MRVSTHSDSFIQGCSRSLEFFSYINKYSKTEILPFFLLLTQLIGNRSSCCTIQG